VSRQMFAEILSLHRLAASHTSTSAKTARVSDATTAAVRLDQGGRSTLPGPRRQLAVSSAVCSESVWDLLLPKAPESGDFLTSQGGDLANVGEKMILASQLLGTRNVGPRVIEPDLP